MNQLTTTDRIFKEQLNEVDFPQAQKDEMWEKMNNRLDADKSGRKRPVVWFVLAGLLAGGALTGILLIQKTGGPSQTASSETKDDKPAITEQATGNVSNSTVNNISNNISANNENNFTIASTSPSGNISGEMTEDFGKQTGYVSGSGKVSIKQGGAFEDAAPVADKKSDRAESIKEEPVIAVEENNSKVWDETKKATLPETKPMAEAKPETKNEAPLQSAAKTLSKPGKKDNTNTFSIGIEGNYDLFKKNGDMGYSAGIVAEKIIKDKVSVSVGAQYNKNDLSMNYSLADKDPNINRVIVAKLHSLSMIRIPVMYKQKLPVNNMTMQAGVVPSIITGASFTNVPNNFTGNPASQKVFEMKDINRFNLMFSAGLQYDVTRRIKLQANGYYGLTGIVKNSYLNRSRVNDNLRSVQVGAVIRLK